MSAHSGSISSNGGAVSVHCPPPTRRGLSRMEAAQYIGISPTKFDELIADSRMPRPKKIDGRRVWDLRKLDNAFEQIDPTDSNSFNEWD